MPADLVREAKARAARRGATLGTIVSEALARSLEDDGARTNELDRELRASERWYARQQPRLLKRYRGQYVAIHDRAVVDHDRDFAALAARVFARLGVRPVFMPRVVEREEAVRIRSPRLARA
jgi:hypothetical protein